LEAGVGGGVREVVSVSLLSNKARFALSSILFGFFCGVFFFFFFFFGHEGAYKAPLTGFKFILNPAINKSS
jgi:hypothetical protein